MPFEIKNQQPLCDSQDKSSNLERETNSSNTADINIDVEPKTLICADTLAEMQNHLDKNFNDLTVKRLYLDNHIDWSQDKNFKTGFSDWNIRDYSDYLKKVRETVNPDNWYMLPPDQRMFYKCAGIDPFLPEYLTRFTRINRKYKHLSVYEVIYDVYDYNSIHEFIKDQKIRNTFLRELENISVTKYPRNPLSLHISNLVLYNLAVAPATFSASKLDVFLEDIEDYHNKKIEPQSGLFSGGMPNSTERSEWKDLLYTFNHNTQEFNKNFKDISSQFGDLNTNLEDVLKHSSMSVHDIRESLQRFPDHSEREKWRKEFCSLNNTFETLLDRISGKGAEGLFSKITDDVGTKIDNGIYKYFTILILFSSSAYVYHTKDYKMLPLIAVASCYYMYNWGCEEVYNIIVKVLDYFSTREDKITPQSGIPSLAIPAAILSLIGCKESKKPFTTEIYDKIANLDKVEKSLSSFFVAGVNLVELVVNFFRENILHLPALRFMMSQDHNVSEYLRKLDALMFEINQKNITNTPDNYLKLIRYRKEGEAIYKQIPCTNDTRNMLSILSNQINVLRKTISDWERSNPGVKGARVETTMVMLRGGAGVGKSTTMLNLCYALLALNLNESEFSEALEDKNKFVHMRIPENVYWDGYWEGTFILCIDDWGQAADVAGQPDSEFMNWIRMASGFEVLLHMSKTEDKANTYFNSPIAIGTTNHVRLTSKSITHLPALARRMNVSVVVTIKKEYCTPETKSNDIYNRKLDVSLLPEIKILTENISALTPGVQEYWLVDEEGQIVVGSEVLDFQGLVDLVQKEHLKRKDWFRANKVVHEETLQQFRAQYRNNGKPLSREVTKFPNPYERIVPQSGLGDRPDMVYEVLSAFNETVAVMLKKIKDSAMTKFLDLIRAIPKPLIYLIGALITYVVVKQLFKIMQPLFKYLFPNLYKFYILQIDPVDVFSVYDDRKDEWYTYEEYAENNPHFHSMVMESLNSGDWKIHKFPTISKMGDKIYLDQTRALDMLKNKDSPLSKFFSQSFGNNSKPVKGKQPRKDYKAIAKSLKAQPQGPDPSGEQLRDKLLRRNQVWLELIHPSGEREPIGNALGLKGHIVAMPMHYYKDLVFQLEYGNHENFLTMPVRISVDDKVENFITVHDIMSRASFDIIGKDDQCLIELPAHCMRFSDIMKNIASLETHDKLDGNITYELPVRGKDSKIYSGIAYKNTREIEIESEVHEPYTVTRTFFYKANTQKGDCGSPFMVFNSRIPREKIFGMHIAANQRSGEGYSTPLIRELLEEEMALMDLEEQISLKLPEPDIIETDVIHPQNGMLYIGSLKEHPKRGGKQTLAHSKLEGVFEKTINAVPWLNPFSHHITGEIINPMLKAQSKYSIPRVPIDRTIFNDIVNELYAHYKSVALTSIDKRSLTLKEALHGYENMNYLRPISMSTGAGYPMNLKGYINWKLEYANNPEYALPIIQEMVEKERKQIDSGIFPLTIYTDTLKEEKLPIHKVLDGKARGFSMVPFIRCINQKIYFGSFVAWMSANSTLFGFSSGMNVYSYEWHHMFSDLSQFDGSGNLNLIYVLTGDYSSYDGSISPELLDAVFKIIEMYYGDEFPQDNFRRKALWCDMISSVHIVDGKMYLWSGNNTSGNFLTFFLNCIVNTMIMMYCWYRLVGAIKLFFSKVSLKVGGDDSIQSVSRTYRDLYNGMTIPRICKEIGITFTTEDKQESVTPFKVISEVEFLKRTFRRCNMTGRVIAPLRYEVVKDMPLWTRTYDTEDKIVMDNVRTAMAELSLWHNNTDNLEFPKQDYKRLLKNFEDLYPYLKKDPMLYYDIDYIKKRTLEGDYILPDM